MSIQFGSSLPQITCTQPTGLFRKSTMRFSALPHFPGKVTCGPIWAFAVPDREGVPSRLRARGETPVGRCRIAWASQPKSHRRTVARQVRLTLSPSPPPPSATKPHPQHSMRSSTGRSAASGRTALFPARLRRTSAPPARSNLVLTVPTSPLPLPDAPAHPGRVRRR